AYTELMIRCWDSDPKMRPTGLEIANSIIHLWGMALDYTGKLLKDGEGTTKIPSIEKISEYFADAKNEEIENFFLDDLFRLLNTPSENNEKSARFPK
ncbi:5781_t:CDS:1, partial [Dentiscutata heterogama]